MASQGNAFMWSSSSRQRDEGSSYLETIRQQFQNRKRHGNVEKRWTEMKDATVNAAARHLQRRRPVKKKWITEDTLKLIEEKHLAFGRWQEVRTDVDQRREYTNCC